jgi:hypothetical protein
MCSPPFPSCSFMLKPFFHLPCLLQNNLFMLWEHIHVEFKSVAKKFTQVVMFDNIECCNNKSINKPKIKKLKQRNERRKIHQDLSNVTSTCKTITIIQVTMLVNTQNFAKTKNFTNEKKLLKQKSKNTKSILWTHKFGRNLTNCGT